MASMTRRSRDIPRRAGVPPMAPKSYWNSLPRVGGWLRKKTSIAGEIFLSARSFFGTVGVYLGTFHGHVFYNRALCGAQGE